MSKKKITGLLVSVLVGVLLLSFIMGLFGLGWMKFFNPRKENIRREVFEQTQSYVHGKIQDLAKYHDEYRQGNENDKECIRQLIIVRFAEFDESKIKSTNLRNFLKRMRGY